MRSSVPDARSRCMVIAVMMNITNSGNRPSRIRQALLNGAGVPGRCGALSNMKYISVITNTGHQQDHRDAAMVGGQLAQDPRRGGRVGFSPAGLPGLRHGAALDHGQKRVLQ